MDGVSDDWTLPVELCVCVCVRMCVKKIDIRNVSYGRSKISIQRTKVLMLQIQQFYDFLKA